MKKHILIVTIIILVCIYVLIKPNDKSLPYFENTPTILDVEITGAVKKPGTYQITKGMSLAYLIDLSGGLLETADISNVLLGTIVTEKRYNIPNYTQHVEDIILRINLNTASYAQLILIPSMTENRALEILLYKKGTRYI